MKGIIIILAIGGFIALLVLWYLSMMNEPPRMSVTPIPQSELAKLTNSPGK